MEKFKNVKAIIIGVVIVAVIALGGIAFALANKADEEELEDFEETVAVEETKKTEDKVELSEKEGKTKKIEDKEEPTEIKKTSDESASAASKEKVYKGPERVEIECKAIGGTYEVFKEAREFITIKEHKNAYNDAVGCKENYVEFIGKIKNETWMLAAIHRLEGEYTLEQIEEKHPMATYMGRHEGYTYICDYTGDFETDEQSELFADIMNDNFSEVAAYFHTKK